MKDVAKMSLFGIELSPLTYALLSTMLVMAEAILLYLLYGALMKSLSARLPKAKHHDGSE